MDQPGKLLYLSAKQVADCGLGPAELIDALDAGFKLKGEGKVNLPPKPGVFPRPGAFIHAMPCYVGGGLDAAGIKWVAGFPDNPDRGLPYISGVLILNDAATGLTKAVMDANWITGWRTAAVSALSARYLARPGAEVMAICGLGVQARTHLPCLNEVLPDLKQVRCYDISEEAIRAYLAEMTPQLPNLEIVAAGSAREAIDGADVIVTAGPLLKDPSPVIEQDWLIPGALGLPIDFDSYFGPSALLAADKFLTDDTDQILYYKKEGYFKTLPPIHGDLGQLASGQVKGRENDRERIIVCSLGLALDDVVAASLIYQRAVDRGLGHWLDL